MVGASLTGVVGAPAAVASYLHAREVVARSDPAMADWLPLTTDGMLLAALVVMWARRMVGDPIGRGPWAAFALGMVATIAANLAAAPPTTEGYIVALWPPVALAVTLELVAVLVRPVSGAGDARPQSAPAGRHVVPPAAVAAPPVEDATPPVTAADLVAATAPADSDGDQVADLINKGYGRARLARELDITPNRARALIEQHRQPSVLNGNERH